MLPLPPPQKISLYQQQLNDVIWHGKQPKMKLINAAMHPTMGGIGMIDIKSRLVMQKLLFIQAALDTQHLQFWQDHLFSFFIIPFDRLILSNLTYKHLVKFICANKILPLFLSQSLKFWCDFHYKPASAVIQSDKDVLEIISRTAYFNSALATNVSLNKRMSPLAEDFFISKGWFTVADFINCNLELLSFKGRNTFLTYNAALKVQNSIPLTWKQKVDGDPFFITIAQSFIDQKWSAKKLYASLIKSDFTDRLQSWSKEGLTLSLDEFKANARKCTLITNINVKSFFVKFNYKALTLNSQASKFLPVPAHCSFCTLSQETYTHLFWECIFIRPLWNYIKGKLPDKFKEFVTLKTVFFPMDCHKSMTVLFTFVKHYIYKCKVVSIKVSIPHMLNSLKFHIKALYFSVLIVGKENNFFKTWKIILDGLRIQLPKDCISP